MLFLWAVEGEFGRLLLFLNLLEGRLAAAKHYKKGCHGITPKIAKTWSAEVEQFWCKKTLNAPRTRRGNSGHTIAPVFRYFLARFWDQNIKVAEKG